MRSSISSGSRVSRKLVAIQLSRPDVGFLAAAWFWQEGNRTGTSLNPLADTGKIADISRVVNGGDTGLA